MGLQGVIEEGIAEHTYVRRQTDWPFPWSTYGSPLSSDPSIAQASSTQQRGPSFHLRRHEDHRDQCDEAWMHRNCSKHCDCLARYQWLRLWSSLSVVHENAMRSAHWVWKHSLIAKISTASSPTENSSIELFQWLALGLLFSPYLWGCLIWPKKGYTLDDGAKPDQVNYHQNPSCLDLACRIK